MVSQCPSQCPSQTLKQQTRQYRQQTIVNTVNTETSQDWAVMADNQVALGWAVLRLNYSPRELRQSSVTIFWYEMWEQTGNLADKNLSGRGSWISGWERERERERERGPGPGQARSVGRRNSRAVMTTDTPHRTAPHCRYISCLAGWLAGLVHHKTYNKIIYSRRSSVPPFPPLPCPALPSPAAWTVIVTFSLLRSVCVLSAQYNTITL